eukprot:CAMPEP_0202896348 /NCGR_PEP_ID=MMETSP1392-20130828/5370_1 /ASSEMBLY_ACC=CAM_ASM_000868 /TAXON_ID=225041 /ORGANISM="Chlamydomonas chlamydogama, Strain SAG 11-48b" /LENGTH=255 /DNA_ID=CAMNT_0049581675 /DNA_START=121 /DNA_END=888 /DNA_ORIENTATION=+
MRNVIGTICGWAADYFSMRVKLEDPDSLKPGRAYMMGFEPHSALPVGIPCVFSCCSPYLPPFCRGSLHALASSVCFAVPFVRQLWWWLGFRPADKKWVNRLLSSGKSVMLCPGGVQECLYMTTTDELVYLKKRHGFVRMALQHGAPLVPVFAFNQTKAYSWYRPGPPLFPAKLIAWVSRQIGAVPLIIYGQWGTPAPHRAHMSVVVGRPIEVPHLPEPPAEVVQQYLDAFISEMEALFERHKAEAGCESMKLVVM